MWLHSEFHMRACGCELNLKSVLHPRQCCFTTLKNILKVNKHDLIENRPETKVIFMICNSLNDPLEVEAPSPHVHKCIQASTGSRLLIGKFRGLFLPPPQPCTISILHPHIYLHPVCFAEGGRTLQVPREERILWGYSSREWAHIKVNVVQVNHCRINVHERWCVQTELFEDLGNQEGHLTENSMVAKLRPMSYISVVQGPNTLLAHNRHSRESHWMMNESMKEKGKRA